MSSIALFLNVYFKSLNWISSHSRHSEQSSNTMVIEWIFSYTENAIQSNLFKMNVYIKHKQDHKDCSSTWMIPIINQNKLTTIPYSCSCFCPYLFKILAKCICWKTNSLPSTFLHLLTLSMHFSELLLAIFTDSRF